MIGSIRAGNLTAAAADVGSGCAGSCRGGVQLVEVYIIPLPVNGHIAIGIRGDLNAVIGSVRARAGGGVGGGLRGVNGVIIFLRCDRLRDGLLRRLRLPLAGEIDTVHIVDCAEDCAERHHDGGNAFPVLFPIVLHNLTSHQLVIFFLTYHNTAGFATSQLPLPPALFSGGSIHASER
ncbi:hypothetical protein DSECCO2_538100 [anaerobic digester metagenome]